MKRLTYIYLLIPLYTALSLVAGAERWLGAYGALALGSVLSLAVWAIVWLRLYDSGKIRPEFAVLSVLPQFCYFGLRAAEEEFRALFTAPAWQNLYFLSWAATATILILSLRRSRADGEASQGRHDATLRLVTIFIILYCAWAWTSTAAGLFL